MAYKIGLPMSIKTIIISLVTILAFSSCSSSRYGHLPRGKRQKSIVRKHPSKWRKHKYKTIEIAAIPSFAKKPDSALNIHTTNTANKNSTVAIVKKKNQSKALKTNKQTTPQTILPSTRTHKKTGVRQQQKTNYSDFWEGFWGDLLAEIIAALIIGLLIAFFVWLEAIGLGWLVIVISVVVFVLIIIWIGSLIEDLFDMIFS